MYDDYPPITSLFQCFREDNGHLFWLCRPPEHFATERGCNSWNAKYAGMEAGYVAHFKSGDRRVIRLNGTLIYRYTIVWAMHKGEWVLELDHKNRIPLDDHIENLRIATRTQNNANSRLSRNSTSGFKGVIWDRRKQKWFARIGVDGTMVYLGYFDDPAEAHAAYLAAAEDLFGEFAYDGVS